MQLDKTSAYRISYEEQFRFTDLTWKLEPGNLSGILSGNLRV